MPNVEWEVPHSLQTPIANLPLNVPDATTGRTFLIQPESYRMAPALRVTNDNKSQADGSVLHPRYKTGVSVTMTIAFWILLDPDVPDGQPACGSDLVEMNDELLSHLDAIRRLTVSNQRLVWTPSGFANRMLTDIQVSEWPGPSRDGTEVQQTFTLESPFPYAITETEDQTNINNGASAVIPNDGTADSFPVMRVNGPTTTFTLTDLGSGLLVEYDGARPGAIAIPGGGYAEIDFFRGTVFLNGNSTDLIAGVDPTVTDFFPIPRLGGTLVLLTNAAGADVDVLSNDGWA